MIVDGTQLLHSHERFLTAIINTGADYMELAFGRRQKDHVKRRFVSVETTNELAVCNVASLHTATVFVVSPLYFNFREIERRVYTNCHA